MEMNNGAQAEAILSLADCLFAHRHAIDLLCQSSPIVRLQFSILYALLAPVLVKLADVVDGLLEH